MAQRKPRSRGTLIDQKGSAKMADVTYPCYRETKDHKGQWYWVYYAKNGKAIARSSESYVKHSDCEHSIELVKGSKADHVFHEV
jgi:uncharacterized protein YegP (UPF0339 family)